MNKTKQKPLFSIIMPAYNAEAHIEEAMQSILRQTYQNFELIIINDGSTDNTQEIIDKYKASDHRIKSYKQKNKGVVAAANLAASHATGRYITRHDADDVSFPTKLQDFLDTFNKHPEAILVTGNIEVIDELGQFVRTGITPPSNDLLKYTLYVYNPIPNGATAIKRDLFEQVGGYSDVFAEDLHLWTKLYELGEFASTNTFVYKWRINLSGLTHTNQDKTLAKEREYTDIIWNRQLPSIYSRTELIRQSIELLKLPQGIHHKNTFLYTAARIGSRLIKKGYTMDGIRLLLAIASTGRTGLNIALKQIHLSLKGLR